MLQFTLLGFEALIKNYMVTGAVGSTTVGQEVATSAATESSSSSCL